MKKSLLLVALLCCVSFFANAQYTTISINNTTSCDVFVQVDGNVNGGVCAPDYRSGVLAIAPGITTFNDPSMVPGGVNASGGFPSLTATDFFNTVTVYNSEPIATNTCGINGYHLSDCWGTPPPTFVPAVNFIDYTGGCSNSCGVRDIRWTVMSPTHVQIDIN